MISLLGQSKNYMLHATTITIKFIRTHTYFPLIKNASETIRNEPQTDTYRFAASSTPPVHNSFSFFAGVECRWVPRLY